MRAAFIPLRSLAIAWCLVACLALTLSCNPGQRNTRVVDASSLGSDFVRFDGRSPVAFRVVRDGTGRLRISSDLEGSEPDIVIPPASIERGMTMLKIANTGDLHLKFDLYITPDGQRYVYTSSCPLLPRPAQGESFSAFESWPHAVAGFAIGAPREGGSTCE